MPVLSEGRAGEHPAPEQQRDTRPSTVVLVLIALVVAIVLVAQIPLSLDLLDPDPLFEAGHAKTVLWVNAGLALLTVVAAALLPTRLRALALLPGVLAAAAMLAGSLTLGGHLVDFGTALLAFTASWWLGRALLRVLGAGPLRGPVVVELVVGLGVVGLFVLALGRIDLLAWWSVGMPVAGIGAVGLWTAAHEAWSRRGAVRESIIGSSVSAACAGLLALQAGWLLVWLAAPEIMFDALYAKGYLPELWSRTGEIEPLLTHPVLNVTGLMQIVAVPGATFDAIDVGRHMQLLGWLLLVTTTWWWAGRRSPAGPLAALFVGVVPLVGWQTATANDDLILAVGAMAMTIAVFRAIVSARREPGTPAGNPFRIALGIGLLAGACIWLKLNLAPIALVLTAGWLLAGGPLRQLAGRIGGVVVGGLAIAGPAFLLRWIDTGNPVFPAYNDIFKSDLYPPVNETYNFPFWPDAGLGGALRAPYEAIVEPVLMNETAPPGAYGLLVAAVVLAVLVGWRARDRRAALVVWAAVVVGVVAWWVQFRYLRYALPIAFSAVLLLLVQVRGWRPGRATTVGMLAAAAAASALYLAPTVASFWNVPGRDLPFAAAFGRWADDDYLRNVFPEKDVLEAYQRIAPEGANAVSDAHERAFLDGRDLSPFWEVERMLQLSGPSPVTAGDARRRLRDLGIEWAVVTGANRTTQGYLWLPRLLAQHGEIEFADRGWDLYRLVDRPPSPRPLAPCDDRLRGREGCWTATLDATPGLSDGESVGGAVRVVPACAGETVGVRLRTAPEGQPSTVWMDFDSGAGRLTGHSTGTVPPGGTGWVYGTAPGGARSLQITIDPGIEGGQIEQASIARFGGCDG